MLRYNHLRIHIIKAMNTCAYKQRCHKYDSNKGILKQISYTGESDTTRDNAIGNMIFQNNKNFLLKFGGGECNWP